MKYRKIVAPLTDHRKYPAMPEKKQKHRVSDPSDDELAQTSRHKELLLEAVGEGIYGISRDGLATFVNPAAIEMTGWIEIDLLGIRHPARQQSCHAKDYHYEIPVLH